MAINLTPKQDFFCKIYIETGNASDAYRRAYDAGKMKGATINRCAKALLDNAKITARIEEIREQHMDRHNLTVDDLIAELDEARHAAMSAENQQCSAAVAATLGKAKLFGMYKLKNKKINMKGDNLADMAKKLIIEITGGDLPAEYGKILMDSLTSYSKIEKTHNIDILRDTMKRKVANEISALEAAQILESEGVTVPQTILLEIKKELGSISDEEAFDIIDNLGKLMSEGRKRIEEGRKKEKDLKNSDNGFTYGDHYKNKE